MFRVLEFKTGLSSKNAARIRLVVDVTELWIQATLYFQGVLFESFKAALFWPLASRTFPLATHTHFSVVNSLSIEAIPSQNLALDCTGCRRLSQRSSTAVAFRTYSASAAFDTVLRLVPYL